MRIFAHRFLTSLLIAVFLLLPLQGAAAQEAQPGGSPAAPLVAPQAISAIYNKNLIPDGDAEINPYTNYWTDNEGWTQIISYGASCGGNCVFPTPYDMGPTQRGSNFFYLGDVTTDHSNGNNLWLKNKISVASIQSVVNTGKVRYILSGYFGGQTTQTDSAQLHMFFENGSGGSTGSAVIVGNVSPADRQYKTGLLYREIRGTIPSGTVNINLALQAGTLSGSDYRTGFADNLSLVLLPMQAFVPMLSNGAPGLPPKTGFPPPSGVVAFPDGLTRMDIYWTDNSNNELGFEVDRVNLDASVDVICNTKPNVTYCLDPGITQSSSSGYKYLGSAVTYTYEVRAIGQGINSAWATGSGITATMPDSSHRPQPTHGSFTCQAIDVSPSSATFVWNDPFNYEAGFNIYLGNDASPKSTMLEGGTKISLINQNPNHNPGTTITLKMVPFVHDPMDPSSVYESNTSCTATANLPNQPSSGITRFTNFASYPVISLVVDGWEQFPVRPLDIPSGASYYELTGVPAGMHNWTAVTGFWDDWGQRFAMYNYSGSFNQGSSGSMLISIPDMTINDLLTVPPANIGYWEGYYFDSNANCHTAAFKFKTNGTYTFFQSNSLADTGSYSLIQREPGLFITKFRVTDTGGSLDGLLVETHGQFFMSNGPTGWRQITYVYKPQGYVYNPFCP